MQKLCRFLKDLFLTEHEHDNRLERHEAEEQIEVYVSNREYSGSV